MTNENRMQAGLVACAVAVSLCGACNHDEASIDVDHGTGASDFSANVDAAGDDQGSAGTDGGAHTIKKVFIVLMENANWSTWKGSTSAPYLNGTLLPTASHAEMYFNPPGNHPSLPNYLWLESGSNLGVTADGTVAQYHQSTTDHLVNQLEQAGHTWKAYVENIDGMSCPVTDSGLFVARHVPMLYFDDVTNPATSRCTDHIRPYGELAADLSAGKTADYNFITPNLCDDAHGSDPLMGDFTCVVGITDLIQKGDTFLSTAVPMITASPAFAGGVLFITWDEGEGSLSDGPIGFIAVGQGVKGGNYASTIKYDHSSTLRTLEEIFQVGYLRAAATANDLSDLFTNFP